MTISISMSLHSPVSAHCSLVRLSCPVIVSSLVSEQTMHSLDLASTSRLVYSPQQLCARLIVAWRHRVAIVKPASSLHFCQFTASRFLRSSCATGSEFMALFPLVLVRPLAAHNSSLLSFPVIIASRSF